ncbi:MAG: hypothetical protein ACE14L_05450 [Terriglobales bacterium]
MRARTNALLIGLLLAASSASAQGEPLNQLLERGTRQVSSYLEVISDVKCTERVTQLRLTDSGRVQQSEESVFDYLVLLEGGADDLMLNESRMEVRPAKHKKNLPMLLTNGFATLFLIFHPYYRNSFRFQREADDLIDGRTFARVHFDYVTGTRSPVALAVRGREYPLQLTGTAWLEPDTGMIARITATLANDMKDVGLRSLSADIEYAPVRLPGWKQTYRFPSQAKIEVASLRQHWRNVHRFSDYQRFLVGTEESVTKGSIKTQ